MQSPLPEVPEGAPISISEPALWGVNVVVGVDFVLFVAVSILASVFVRSQPEMPSTYIVPKIEISFYLISLFYLWRRSNWARWIFILLGLISIFAFVEPLWLRDVDESPFRYPELHRIFVTAKCIWAFGVAIWLLLPGVAKHFKPTSGNTSIEINAG